MSHILNARAIVKCRHGGAVLAGEAQDFVRIKGAPVLVESSLLARPIIACPMATPAAPPCILTVSVDDRPSHSAFVRIDGRRVYKKEATGVTDWAKLDQIPWSVLGAGQDFVTVKA